MLSSTMYNLSGSMSRFRGELLEFPGPTPELCRFVPEFRLEFRNFYARFFECLLPFTGVAKHGLDL